MHYWVFINTAPRNVYFILRYRLFFREKNFFLNVYILVNAIFECSYLHFRWEKGYHFSCFCHMVSCFICRNLHLRHIIQYICAIVFNFLEQLYGRNSDSKCVHILARENGIEKSTLRYVRTKWIAPNKYCGIFFVHWYSQVH